MLQLRNMRLGEILGASCCSEFRAVVKLIAETQVPKECNGVWTGAQHKTRSEYRFLQLLLNMHFKRWGATDREGYWRTWGHGTIPTRFRRSSSRKNTVIFYSNLCLVCSRWNKSEGILQNSKSNIPTNWLLSWLWRSRQCRINCAVYARVAKFRSSCCSTRYSHLKYSHWVIFKSYQQVQ